MNQIKEIEKEIEQQENDVKEIKELLQEDPEDIQLQELLKESEECLLSLQQQLQELQSKEKEYQINDKIYAWNECEKNWYSAIIKDIQKENNQMIYTVSFSSKDIQQVTKDQIKPLTELHTISFQSTENHQRIQREIRRVKLLKEKKINSLPESMKPKPNDNQDELDQKRKQRHKLKSIMKQQTEEEELVQMKKNWKVFSSKFQKK